MASQQLWEFNGRCVLVFSDVHQRLNWMRAVIDKEKGKFDKLVFLGDMFDTHHLELEVSGIRETAKEYTSLIDDPNNLVLAGNHDIPYLECWSDSKRFSSKKHIFNPCSGFSKSRSIEIAKELDMTVNDVKESMKNSGRHLSMDAPLVEGEDSNLYDVLRSGESPNPDRELIHESLQTEIERALETLTPREADVVRLYFGLGDQHPMTLEEIGETFDLTRERVRQIKEKAIRRLKHTSRSKILKTYLG